MLIHTAIRTFGHIDGGAVTAMEAFLEALEPRDTLLTPAFTFCHKAEEDPIIDPCRDPSKMGAITEALRQHLQALRSTAVDENIFAQRGARIARLLSSSAPKLRAPR